MDNNKIGERLEDLRGKITQVEFSKILNVAQGSYAFIISGKRNITLKMIFAIHKHYGAAAAIKVLFGENSEK
jgi:plasmid maintenance system antidote protein VapI